MILKPTFIFLFFFSFYYLLHYLFYLLSSPYTPSLPSTNNYQHLLLGLLSTTTSSSSSPTLFTTSQTINNMPLARSFTQKLTAKLHRSPSSKNLRATSISAPVSPSTDEVPPMPLDQFYSINFEDTVDPANASSAPLPLSRTASLLSKKSNTPSHASGSRSNSFSSSNLTNVPTLAYDSPSQTSTESFPPTPTSASLDYFPATAITTTTTTTTNEQYKKHYSRPSTTSSCTTSTTSSSGFIFIDEPVFSLAQAAPKVTKHENEEADEVALRILAKVSMSSSKNYSRKEVRPVSAVWDI